MNILNKKSNEQLKKYVDGLPTPPDKLVRSLLPAPQDMDLDLLPTTIKEYAIELSNTIGSDPSVSVLAMLSAVCGAANARMKLTLMSGYEVPPVLWFMTIGDPSSKKTPASKPVFQIFRELEKESKLIFNKKMIKWEAREIKYNSEKKKYIDSIGEKNAERESRKKSKKKGKNTVEDTVKDTVKEKVQKKYCRAPEDLPLKPAPLRFLVGDITSQKLVRHCSLRPEGALCYLDEMTGWVKKLTNERGSEDCSAWLESYSASSYTLDRVGDGEIYCDNFAVSIYGNIQPKILKGKIKLLSESGLLQRFIPVALQNKFNKVGTPLLGEPGKVLDWEKLIRNVYNNKKLEYSLSEKAYDVFRDFQYWVFDYKRYLSKINDDDVVMTAIGKIEGVVGRLALIFHLTENSSEKEVSEDTMSKAVELAKDFIIPAYRRTYGNIEIGSNIEIDIWVIGFILKKSSSDKTISLRELKRGCSSLMKTLDIDDDNIKTALLSSSMASLEMNNWVTRDCNVGNSVKWSINRSLSVKLARFRKKFDNAVKAFREDVEKKYRMY